MAASPARIGFIQQQFRHAVAESPLTKERHGSLARESDDPVETFFDSEADAQIVADARQALLSVERRRFRLTATDLSEVLDLEYALAVPRAQYVDAERDADRPVLLSEIVFDFSRQSATLTIWG